MRNYILSGLALLIGSIANAQKANWQNLDLLEDTVFGISTEKAYNLLLKEKKATKIIIAVIDSGIDTAHEDLKDVIWTNLGEIPGNGIDDDRNGYVDDIHGWNFVGGEKGKEDLVNLLRPKRAFFDSLSYTRVPEIYRADYQKYRKLWSEYPGHIDSPHGFIAELETSEKMLQDILRKIGEESPTINDFRNYKPSDDKEKELIEMVVNRLPYYKTYEEYKSREIVEVLQLLRYHLSHGLSMEDTAVNLPSYENNNGDVSSDIIGPVTPRLTAYHGTHIAGIIAAVRGNNIGINGVADHVQIMALKTISIIREMRDNGLADAIRYAVDNGARIINLSFGKAYTWDKKAVDEAVKYAMKKDVLIVHAAGNEGKNLDGTEQFPNPVYADGSGRAEAWIQVGASGYKNDSSLIAAFSNYGKQSVDVFAPGVDINSTIPYSKYTSYGGTSMAAPVVTGLAALIRVFFPKLTAKQVRDIILRSAIRVDHQVIVREGNIAMKKVPFSEVCLTGGIVNAYAALLLAEHYK